MNYDAASRYPSPAQTLTPIYIDASLFATLQKEGRLAQYIAVNSRPAETSLLENCGSIATVNHSSPACHARTEVTSSVADNVINTQKHVSVYDCFASDDIALTEGWEIITSLNSSPPAYRASIEPKSSTANDLVNFSNNTAINSRFSEIIMVESCRSIATVYHSSPTGQESVKASSSVANSAINSSKRVTVFDRIGSDFEARFAKSGLKLKVIKAASDLLDAMAPGSKTDAATAVNRYEASMQEIFSSMDRFRASTLYPGIKNGIAASIQKMTTEKFAGSGLSVTSASIGKIRAILELADRTTVKQPDTTETVACRNIANQTLRIFQEQLFDNVKTETKKITNELLGAAEPRSTTTIAAASEIFMKKMIAISVQRENFKDHDLYEDFAKSIRDSSNEEAISVYYADAKRDNMADWKTKSKKLAEESAAFVDQAYPKDIPTPQAILSKQLRWMKEKEFSNQVEEAITQFFQKRYTEVVANRESEEPDLNTIPETSNLIKNLKTALRDNCKSRNDEEIATEIQSNRDSYQKLLIAGNHKRIVTTSDPSRHEKAVNKFLEDNQGNLDFAVCGMILDHLRSMNATGKYKRED